MQTKRLKPFLILCWKRWEKPEDTQQMQKKRLLAGIEVIAYLMAIWSFIVLFLEPLISYYADFGQVEKYTALANILLLMITIFMGLGQKKDRAAGRRLIFDLIMLALGSMLYFYSAKFVIFFLLIRQTWHILQYILFRAFEGRFSMMLQANPPITLMLSFALVISLGTVILMMPAASSSRTVTAPIDALFTATSATCVTGLVVLDTSSHFSLFGQIVILLLIQIGGLGIMTISTAFAIMFGQRLTLKLENIMYKVVGGNQTLNVLQLLKSIILMTLVIESAGAALLYIRFHAQLPPLKAFYYSVFHSVSAFCSAGFSLFSSNMMGYAGDIIVSFGITILIILGGLGFTVIMDLVRYFFFKEKVRKLALHSKIVLLTTAALLLFGLASYYLTEFYGSMEGFSIGKRLLASWFQSVTTRTAGFNSIDLGRLSRAGILISLVLMFIGASPGSTGGGVKTTTFAVLVLSIISLLKGKKDISVFNRKIPSTNVREATSLMVLSAAIIFVIVFVLLMVEPFPLDQILFEAFSAFGTVGLSVGITPHLSHVGKVLITILMYVGRIGPLTLIYAFAIKRQAVNIGFAEEKIAIG